MKSEPVRVRHHKSIEHTLIFSASLSFQYLEGWAGKVLAVTANLSHLSFKIYLYSSRDKKCLITSCLNEYVKPPGISIQRKSLISTHQAHFSQVFFVEMNFRFYARQNRWKRLCSARQQLVCPSVIISLTLILVPWGSDCRAEILSAKTEESEPLAFILSV